MAFATELLAGEAWLRILHDPDIAAVLDGSGPIPGPHKTTDRPGADQTRAGRAIERNSRASACSGKMGGRGIRPNVNGRPLEQPRKFGPIEMNAGDRRASGLPEAVQIGPLRGIRPLRRDNGKPAIMKVTGKRPPSGIGPALVPIERVGMQDGVWFACGKTGKGGGTWADDLGCSIETKCARKRHQLRHTMRFGFRNYRNLVGVALPTCAGHAGTGDKPNPAAPRN